jgi:hypothetical protein
MRALKIAHHGNREAWTEVRTPRTNKPLRSTKQTLLRILSSEKAIIIAVVVRAGIADRGHGDLKHHAMR